MSVITDRDGSLTGIAGAAVTVNNPLLIDASCQMRADWNAAVCPVQLAAVHVQAFSSWDPLIAPLNIQRDDGTVTPTMDGYSQRWVALNVPTRRTYTVRYPTRAALGIRIAYEHLSDGEWVRLTVPYTYAKFVMHREGDNFVPINPVGTIAELDHVARTTYVYDAAQQLGAHQARREARSANRRSVARDARLMDAAYQRRSSRSDTVRGSGSVKSSC